MHEIYPFVSDMIMFKSCYTTDEYICIIYAGLFFTFFKEIYPFVSEMMMFKCWHTIDEYICIMSGGLNFTFF
ncbi:hypothetical protein T07_10411 [Trichinella nelsoni]|uniref:Uncharacterized protein n=1 Tax=Trichinella nelsoni TaxID=6336 RepID=A0A0V0REB6_9BILA|nr:hypothetical protein T07_10411 [Trichinella nelsoni]